MSAADEVWIRVPRSVFDDARAALLDASIELASAHNQRYDSGCERASIQATNARAALTAHGRGVLINTKETAA